ncbi:MAG: hypothetical protein JEY91_19740, partial [Spirochaetaceae bacterium]|nr:hypothetical protein [Spirochaetaceae bacterium]
MKKIILILFTVLFFFPGCSGLPAPSERADTLLIIPLEHQIDPGVEQTLNYHLQIKNKDTDKIVKTTMIISNRDYITIKGLKPGEYYISGYISNWIIDNSRYKTVSYNRNFAPFSIRKGNLTMLPIGFGLKVVKMENENVCPEFLTHTSRDGVLQQKRLLEIEKEYPVEFSAWAKKDLDSQDFTLEFSNLLD